MKNTLASLAQKLASKQTSAVQLVTEAWAKYDVSGNEQLFTVMLREASLERARLMDAGRATGETLSPFAGIPITVKDLFDIEGIVTTAGSKVLEGSAPASHTAPCIQRLLDAGFIILGKVNMTEFAYSGLGLNPHFGTPVNPYSIEHDLIPGGSSSGSAVSVASELVCASIGTDTGGSVRIPASFCNLTGFKPGGAYIDQAGVIPLAETLDCVGPLGNSVECCADLAAIMSGRPVRAHKASDITTMRLLIPENAVWEQIEESVEKRSKSALAAIQAAGAEVYYRSIGLFDQLLASGVQGVIAGYESHRWHQKLLAADADRYDPRVRVRLDNGSRVPVEAYQQALVMLGNFRQEFSQLMHDYDAILWPTTARTAPRFDELVADEDYDRINLLVLRNTAIGNVLDAASITVPLNPISGQPPAGLMISCPAQQEESVVAASLAVQGVLRSG